MLFIRNPARENFATPSWLIGVWVWETREEINNSLGTNVHSSKIKDNICHGVTQPTFSHFEQFMFVSENDVRAHWSQRQPLLANVTFVLQSVFVVMVLPMCRPNQS
jgi:hypothetical protein